MNIDDVLKLVNAGYTREEIDKMTQNPGNEPGQNPGSDPGQNPGSDPGQNPGSDPGQNPGNDPGQNPGNDPGQNPGNDPGQNPGNDPGQNQEVDQLRQEMTRTRSDISAMMKELQKLNLKTNTLNVTPADDVSTRAAQALAEIIRPTFKKEA